MKIFFIFARQYPYRSLFTILAMLLAGIADGFGIAVFIPLLALILGQDYKGFGASQPDASGWEATLLNYLNSMLATFGVANMVAGLLAMFVACITLKCALMIIAHNQVGFTAARITTDLRHQFLQVLFRTRWEYFLRQPLGKIVGGITGQSAKTASAFTLNATMISYGIEAGIYTIIAVVVSWKTTLLALSIALSIVFVLRPYVKKARQTGKRRTELSQNFRARMTDSLISIKPLKAMGRESSTYTVLKRQTTGLNHLQKEVVASRAMLSNLQEPLMMGFVAIILYMAVIKFQMSLPIVVAMVYLIRRILKKFHKIQQEYQKVVVLESAYWSMMKKRQEAEDKEEAFSGTHKPTFNKAIRFDKISFGYDKENKVLRDFCLELPKGQFMTVIGPSGAGKTTLADLVIGLVRPQQGEIWIDDVPLGDVDIRQWRRMIGYVPQETFLLHDTILTNVSLGGKGISESDVEAALKAAGAWVFVSNLDQGMHAVVGERGSKISGGQRQRIAIARALVNKPRLLILDEATTALDPETEKAVCETMAKLSEEITIFAISHQKALLEAADIAYRLEDGALELVKNKADQMDIDKSVGNHAALGAPSQTTIV